MKSALDTALLGTSGERPPVGVSLIDADDGLRAAVPVAELQVARRLLVARRLDLSAGPWAASDERHDGRPFGVLVVDGAILEATTVAGRPNAQLLGPGALLRPWDLGSSELPSATSWTVLSPGAVAVLDDRFLRAAQRWPALLTVVHDRLSDQYRAAARRAALCSLSRVEDRVLGLFWELADQWGVVRSDGISIRLPLTHELIGRMIGAKRPTVSLALATLIERGLVVRTDAHSWTVTHASRAVLT